MFSLKEVLEITGGRLEGTNQAKFYNGISIDSRTIKKGELFVAIEGKRYDGHNFIKAALARGAGAALSNQKVRFNQAQDKIIRVDDTLESLGRLANYHRLRFDIPVVVVTGSNGKTTTKDMISHVLSETRCVLKSKGTENNTIGLSLTLLRLNQSHEVAVVEIGSNHPGEIAQLCEIASPTIGVVTSIGPSHLEFFKTVQAVAREKLSLLSYLKSGIAILNGDDIQLSSTLVSTFKGSGYQKIIFYGTGNNNDFQAEDIHTDLYRTGFTLKIKKKCKREYFKKFLNNRYEVKLKVPGRHSVFNTLATFAVAGVLNLRPEQILHRLSTFRQHHMRLYPRRIRGLYIVDDTYNANPASLEMALRWLSELNSKGRKILVCADMLELGEVSKRYHRKIGHLVAYSGIDFLIGYGPEAREMVSGASQAGMEKCRLRSYLRPQALVRYLLGLVKPGDILLFKGSRRMQMEKLKECFITSYTP